MSSNDYPSDDRVLRPYKYAVHYNRNQRQRQTHENPLGNNQRPFTQTNELVQMILVCSCVGLSVLGVIAYLITRDIAIAVTLNGPLLAIITGFFYQQRRDKSKADDLT